MNASTPLHGLRVVELASTFSGALAAHFFADNGAEVIVVEPPRGSAVRELPAHPVLNRGKKSVVLDVHDEADRAQLRALLSQADVFVESMRPGVAMRRCSSSAATTGWNSTPSTCTLPTH